MVASKVKNKTKVLAFRLQPELEKRLDREADRLGIRRTELARAILAQGLQQGGPRATA